MEAVNFCYWLQGYFELSKTSTLTTEQVDTIKNHLNMVFLHDIDPKAPQAIQGQLNQLHNASLHMHGDGHPNARC